jgi:hypothetical protein
VLATSTDAEWSMRHGDIRIRLLFRDINDPETPPEYTALWQMHGIAQASGCGLSAEEALEHAEAGFLSLIVAAARLYGEIRRGKPEADPE